MADTLAEKRRHYRFAMSYPVKLYDQASQQLTASQTVNLSRGGVLLPVPQEMGNLLGQTVNVTVSLPKESYRTEADADFACQAQVVRQEEPTDLSPGRIALQFARPMQLAN